MTSSTPPSWSKRDYARLARQVARVARDVARQRRRHGPRRPNWGFRLECLVELAQRLQRPLHDVDDAHKLQLLRHLIPPVQKPHPQLQQEQVVVAGVPCVRVRRRRGPAPEACLVYVHGGGYVFGSPTGAGGWFNALLDGWPGEVLSVDYRLCPEHPWPAPLDDAMAVVDDCEQRFGTQGVVLAGDSAGGACVLSCGLRRRHEGKANLAGIVAISPWVNHAAQQQSYDQNADSDLLLEATVRFCATQLVTDDDTWLQPAHCDVHGLPPVQLVVGGGELFADDLLAFHDQLRQAQVDVELVVGEHMPHVYVQLAALCEEGRRDEQAMVRFVRRQTRR